MAPKNSRFDGTSTPKVRLRRSSSPGNRMSTTSAVPTKSQRTAYFSRSWRRRSSSPIVVQADQRPEQRHDVGDHSVTSSTKLRSAGQRRISARPSARLARMRYTSALAGLWLGAPPAARPHVHRHLGHPAARAGGDDQRLHRVAQVLDRVVPGEDLHRGPTGAAEAGRRIGQSGAGGAGDSVWAAPSLPSGAGRGGGRGRWGRRSGPQRPRRRPGGRPATRGSPGGRAGRLRRPGRRRRTRGGCRSGILPASHRPPPGCRAAG
jgi:hypothetical protein